MKGIPLLAKLPQKRRNVLFAPSAFGIFLVVFLAVGFPTSDPFIAGLVALPVALAGAWALYGWPVVARKDGKPLVDPKTKPFLFFVLAPLFTALLYPVLGVFVTKAGVPTKYLALTSLALAFALACTAAYFLVGFPHVTRATRHAYERIPPERRPFLFFPVFAVIFLVLYIGLGVGFTAALGRFFSDRVVALLDIQVLLLLPVTLVLSVLLAYLLVGFPRPQKPLRESIPRVPGRHRARAFLLTFLLAGIPLTIAIGALLTYAAKGAAAEFLPEALLLPLALVLGYSLSLGLTAALLGTPARWRKFDDYTPGLSPRARLSAAGALGLAVMLAVVVAFGIAGIDIFWGLLMGFLLGLSMSLVMVGMHRRIAARRSEATLLPELPDRAKSLILFSTWLVLALVVFSVLTYSLPGLVAWNALLAIVLGLVIAFVMVEQGLLQRTLADWRAQREKRKAWQKRRKEALARGAIDDEAARETPR